MSAHPNSKTIRIERHLPLSHENQKDAKEWIDTFSKSVGSYFLKGTKKTASGLNYKEEELLMPILINIEPTDRDFKKKVELYFSEITTRVPAKGKFLEIGLELDNTKSISKENMPLEVEQYVAYRHALGFPFLALTKSAAKSSSREIWFYIVDDAKIMEDTINQQDVKDKATELYLINKNDPKKVAMYLTLMGEDIRKFPIKDAEGRESKDGIDKRRMKLVELRDARPSQFIAVVEDKNLEIKYDIERLIQKGILRRVDRRIVDAETNIELGSDMEATVLKFKDETFTADKNLYLAKLKGK